MMVDTSSPQSSNEPKIVSRKPYHTPQIQEFGDLGHVTATNAAGPNFDGGSGANIYAS